MSVALIRNRAQQRLVLLAKKAREEKVVSGKICQDKLRKLTLLYAIIETLTLRGQSLSTEELQLISNTVNNVDGYLVLPYADFDEAFQNTRVDRNLGGGVTSYNDLTDKPTSFPSTIGNVSGLSNKIITIESRITALESGTTTASTYTNLTPTNVAVGNVPTGTTFNNVEPGDVFDLLFYATLAPQVLSFSNENSSRVFTSATNDTATISWTVRRRTNPITSIVITDSSGTTYTQAIDAAQNAVDGGTWSGTQVVPLNENTANTISIAVTASGTTNNSASASTYVYYYHNRFWFTTDEDFITKSDSDISTALNALGGSNKELASNRDMPLRVFTGSPGAPKNVVTAYLASYGDASFVVNAAANNAWTTKTFSYTNERGYTVSFKLNQFNDVITGTANIDQN